MAPNTLTKEESRRVYKCDDERLSGSTKCWIFKVCEICKVRSIESLKYIRQFHTPVCYCGDISTPRNVTLNETNYDWLFDMSVKQPHGQALANKTCHLFQTFSCQFEGLATRDYIVCKCEGRADVISGSPLSFAGCHCDESYVFISFSKKCSNMVNYLLFMDFLHKMFVC